MPALRLVFDASADPEDMAVRVADVHFADVPGHVGWRPGDVEVLLETSFVDGIDIVHPHRHPGTFVRGLVAGCSEGHFVTALAAATLTALAKKYLTLT